jgi:hypothetical protein
MIVHTGEGKQILDSFVDRHEQPHHLDCSLWRTLRQRRRRCGHGSDQGGSQMRTAALTVAAVVVSLFAR